ncbi:MAG: hypothetical protein ACTSYF_12900 [Promethearchaeota archaeon]
MAEEYKPIIKPVKEEVELPEGASRPKVERMEVPGLPGTTKEISVEEKPLSLLGDPFLVEYLKLGTLYEDDIDELKTKVGLIDKWIKKQILKREWKPIVKSYLDILEELKKKIGISDNQTPLSQINKIYIYLKLSGKK